MGKWCACYKNWIWSELAQARQLSGDREHAFTVTQWLLQNHQEILTFSLRSNHSAHSFLVETLQFTVICYIRAKLKVKFNWHLTLIFKRTVELLAWIVWAAIGKCKNTYLFCSVAFCTLCLIDIYFVSCFIFVSRKISFVYSIKLLLSNLKKIDLDGFFCHVN